MDSPLTFENHINKICKKVSQNVIIPWPEYLHALENRKTLMKAFIAFIPHPGSY